MTVDPVLAWAFAGIGVFALGFAALLLRRPLTLMRAGGRARGTVESSETVVSTSGKGGPRTYYLPNIAFKTAKGERIVFRSASGGGVALPIGTEVSVLYDPANPREAERVSFATMWLFPLVTALFGLPFLAIGLAGFL